MLIEIHILQNHAPSNLNRDDTGSVKDCVFGGVTRTRISSQCLKRSIRKSSFFEDTLAYSLGGRTKFLPEEVKKRLIEKGITSEISQIWAEKLTTIGKSDKKKSDGEEKTKDKRKELDTKQEAFLETAQLMFYGENEINKIIDYVIAEKGIDIKKIDNKGLIAIIQKALSDLKAKPVDVALFGRMTTMEAFEDVSAACQVAHAISVNKHSVDFDYFTAVDDLSNIYREDSGSAHLGETEFTSACFYKYIAIDYDTFVKSIGEDNKLAKVAISALVNAAALSNPTGKQNSFAAHNPPHFIGIEIKNKKIPVNLANAFIKPVAPDNKLSLNDKSIDVFSKYAKKNRDAFSLPMKDQAHFIFSEEDKLGNEFSDKSFVKLTDLIAWLETHTGA